MCSSDRGGGLVGAPGMGARERSYLPPKKNLKNPRKNPRKKFKKFVCFCGTLALQELMETEHPLVNDFQIRERGLIKEWGVEVTEIAAARRAYLRQNVHWQWRDTQVYYSPSGRDELLRYVVPKSPQERLEGRETGRQLEMRRHLPNAYPLSLEVVVVDRIYANPFLIRASDVMGAP